MSNSRSPCRSGRPNRRNVYGDEDGLRVRGPDGRPNAPVRVGGTSPGVSPDRRSEDVEGEGERDLEHDRFPTGVPHQEGHNGAQRLMVDLTHRHNTHLAKNDTAPVPKLQLLAARWMIVRSYAVTRRGQTACHSSPQSVPG